MRDGKLQSGRRGQRLRRKGFLARVWFAVATISGLSLGILATPELGVAQGAGSALDFDGLNDVVLVPDHSSLDLTSGWTLEAWIYPRAFDHYHTVIHKSSVVSQVNYWVGTYADSANSGFLAGSWREHSAGLANPVGANQWHHIVATFDNPSNSYRLYVNGIPRLAATETANPLANNSSLQIGDGQPTNGEEFDGRIDEVRVWNRALLPSEIQSYMHRKLTGAESGLVGNWRFDDGSGGTAGDNGPFGNHGALTNMTTGDWVLSTAPVGDASIFGSGSATLSETGAVQADLIWKAAPGAGALFSAIQIDAAPAVTTGLSGTVPGRHWELWITDNGAFVANPTFHFDGLGFTDESNLKLYTRPDAASSWTEVSTYSVDTEGDAGDGVGSITAEGLTSFSQFIITGPAAATTYSIEGFVFEDVNGDGDIIDDGVPTGSVLVPLYRDGGDGVPDGADDALVTTEGTDPSGQFLFGDLPDGTYWVVVDSRSFRPGAATTDVWAEQTYGSAGSVTQTGGTYSFSPAGGPLYGGKRSEVSDDVSTLVSAEHVTRITISGADVTGLDFGFSFNVVSNTRDGDDDPVNGRTVQGSLRQFLQNTSGNVGTKTSRFAIPTTDSNYNAGTNSFLIRPVEPMQFIDGSVHLDAATQAGYDGTPIIDLDGSLAGAGAHGFESDGGGSFFRGFTIRDFDGSGFSLSGSGPDTIVGNYIGTDISGAVAQGNRIGVDLSSGADDTRVGGTAVGEGNIIAFNTEAGVRITGAVATPILGNSVFGNGGLGIDLGDNGVTPNDGVKSGAQPNSYMDYPIFGSVALNGTMLTVSGYVGSAAGQSTFANARVEIFKADNTPADQNGEIIAGDGLSVPHGEGGNYLGFLTTDANGGFSGSLSVSGLSVGDSITGSATDAGGNTSEFGADATVAAPSGSYSISGTIFEDVNYGGGPGRGLSTLGIVTRPGAKVELYDAAGSFADSTTTDGSGQYTFTGLADANYQIRVVNSTVSSSRPSVVKGLLPVQTYRTDASSGTAVAVTNKVGGEIPHQIDPAINTTGASLEKLNDPPGEEVQSLAGVGVSGADVTGVDFGFNFSTTVNTNASGQGSLDQFIVNANALGNTGLAQSGHTAGIETSLFEIPTTDPNYDLAGAGEFTIQPTAALPIIADPVIIDGTTQPGFSGTPIIVLDGASAGGGTNGLYITAGNSTVRGLVIRSFAANGINISTAGSNTIAGNYIGTDAAGTADQGNTMAGILITGVSSNVLGGASEADRNVISGNNTFGIQISGAGAESNVVQGNYIGVDANGTGLLGNASIGLYAAAGSAGTIIGGSGNGEGNVIGGNLYGIGLISSNKNTVFGNYVGTDATGTANLANANTGILMSQVTASEIGGTGSGEANSIAFNTADGIWLLGGAATSEVLISGNSIYSNGGLGIDLGLDGVAPNDAGDTDTGENGLQNYPILSSAVSTGTEVRITGTLNSNPNTTVTLEFFENSTADASGNGEGQSYLGSADIVTDGSGDVSFDETLSATVSIGSWISATATGPGWSTGEFSNTVQVPPFGFVVDTNSDVADGDTTSIANLVMSKGADGFISLREAISATNQTPNGATPDSIIFGIGSGAQTITPTVALPAITEAVVIDGTTQPGFSGAPIIEISGATMGAGYGLEITAGGSTIRGLVINRFATGLALTGGSGHTIVGNYLGPDLSGAIGNAGNTQEGLLIAGSRTNRIGGASSADRNVISGNRARGIWIDDFSDGAPAISDANRIYGNYIGTNATGTAALPYSGGATQQIGIAIWDGPGNEVGGVGLGNVLSGNSWYGLYVWGPNASGHQILGNIVGMNAAGTGPVGNGSDAPTRGGINLSNTPGNTVGGTAAGEANVIAGNDAIGIVVSSNGATGNLISGNAIFNNAGIGIDLGLADGVTPNDAGDLDAGPNNLQNYPVLSSAVTTGTAVTIQGTYNSAPSSKAYIEFFSSSSADPTGNGEGQTYLGTIDVTTDGSGNVSINTVLNVAVVGGSWITATVTDGSNNTSEFSNAVQAAGPRFVVDTNSDVADGDTTSIGALVTNKGADGFISLREAISATNNTPNGAIPDSITFDIGGGGVQTITPATALPAITGAVVIDGTTQPGFTSTPIIEISGANVGSAGIGLDVQGGGSTIRGLVINRFGTGLSLTLAGGNTVVGNYLGPDVTGNIGNVGNATTGIRIYQSPDNVIGGTTASDRNVLSGNGGYGLQIDDSTDGLTVSSGNTRIIGNYIGSDAAGANLLPTGTATSQAFGVLINQGSDNHLGGTASGEGNLISGNRSGGLYLLGTAATGNLIRGNIFGLDESGTNPLPNGTAGNGYPVLIWQASGNTVGGPEAGAPNVISGNEGIGVVIGGGNTTGNLISRNSIYGNTGLGIDLNLNGVDVNDAGDPDVAGNGTQNYPVLTSAERTASTIRIRGTFNGTANSSFTLEFFTNSAADGSGNGEGETFLDELVVNTDGSGDDAIDVTYNVGVAAGLFVTATATDASNSTSEFSNAVEVTEAARFVVDTNSDVADGDTTSIANLLADKGSDGFISLREAISATNNTANGAVPDSITFDIGGGGAQSIVLDESLPEIIEAVVVDGTTQPGFSGTPLIEVNGGSIFASAIGLHLKGGGSTIRGLVVNSFWSYGIQIDSLGGNTIAGNYIGTNAAGDAAAANFASGIRIDTGSNTIGGSDPADRNIIGGNMGGGIALSGAGATGNEIYGNRIGTNAAGDAQVQNNGAGISITSGAASNTIGGVGGLGNVISGGSGAGIQLQGNGTDSNVILGNRIGTNADGTAVIPNSGDGISITSGASSNEIGGTGAGEGNLISGNGSDGVFIDGPGTTTNLVLGNRIGTDEAGTGSIPNGGHGVLLSGNTSGNSIGGTADGAGNVIATNGQDGVAVINASTGNPIRRNSITANTGLGIDLNNDDETANDSGDGDTGPNEYLNFPFFETALFDPVSDTLEISGFAGPGVDMDVFLSDSDASGFGEGLTYLFTVTEGSIDDLDSGTGSYTHAQAGTDDTNRFRFRVENPGGIAGGVVLTATATDGSNNTSEFSYNVTVSDGIDALISSAADQTFWVGKATTAISPITVAEGLPASITAANDLRIRIPSGFDMLWDTLDLSATITGPANGKVSTTVSYEDAGATLVLNVTSDFAFGDTIEIAGLGFMEFTGASGSDNLELEVNNDGVVSATDPQSIEILAAGTPYFESEYDLSFKVGDPPHTASMITVRADAAAPTITAANDIRIKVPFGFNMRWDNISPATILGTGSGKVSSSVSYEDGNATLVIDVISDFDPGDVITIEGLGFRQFTAASIEDNLELEVYDDGSTSAFDPQVIFIVEFLSPMLNSSRNQVFTVGDPATRASTMRVEANTPVAGITAADDIRIKIPAGFDMIWDVTSPVRINGTGRSKVSSAVTFEDGGKTLVIDVLADFNPGQYINVGRLRFMSFTASHVPDNLELWAGSGGTFSDFDGLTKTITGSTFRVDVWPTTTTASKLPSNGTDYTAQFTVSNTGNTTESFDLLTSQVPGGTITVISITGLDVSQGANPDSARITNLPASDSRVVTVTYSVGQMPLGTTDALVFLARPVSSPTQTDQGQLDLTVVRPQITLGKSVNPNGTATPGTDLTYTVDVTNGGSEDAETIIAVDSLPAETEFQVGSISNTLPTGVNVVVEYSDDSGSTWTYTPLSGACGATAGYDLCVNRIRWRFQTPLGSTAPDNVARFEYIARIR